MSDAKLDTLKNLQVLLVYHQSSGVDTYPMTEDISSFLAQAHPTQRRKPTLTKNLEGNSLSAMSTTADSDTIDEIAEEVRICRSCDLCEKRIVPVAGSGGHRVKLLLVGGWLTVAEAAGNTSAIFGREEDLMRERMLRAIGLTQEDAFITNIIKCGISEAVQPKAENIAACLSYLHRQIAAVAPEIICAMGIVATRSLLQVSQPLSQLRGRLHRYRLGDKRAIPVMPTYHPTFLLQNPEMKKATWDDLQIIAKELKQ